MSSRAHEVGKAAGAVARLTGKLALTTARLSVARRQALSGFRQGLAEQGVPGDAIEELCAAHVEPPLAVAMMTPCLPHA